MLQSSRILSYFWFAAAVVFLLYSISVTLQLGNPHLMPDEWLVVRSFLENGPFETLFTPQNGHLQTFPYAFHYVNWTFIKHSQWPLVWTGYVLSFVLLGLLFRVIWFDQSLRNHERILVASTLVIYFYWMGNGFILLVGNESIHCFLVLGSLFVAILAFFDLNSSATDSRGPRNMLIIILASFVAACSFGAGLVLSPTIFALAIIFRARPSVLLQLFCVMVATATVYYGAAGSTGEGIEPDVLFTSDFYLRALRWISAPVLAISGIRVPWDDFQAVSGGWLLDSRALYVVYAITILSLGYVGTHCIQVWRGKRFPGKTSMMLAGTAIAMIGVGVLVTLLRSAFQEAYPQDVFSYRYYVWSSLYWFSFVGLLWVNSARGGLLSQSTALVSASVCLIYLCTSNGFWAKNAWLPIRQSHDLTAEFLYLDISPNRLSYHVLRFFLGLESGEMVQIAQSMRAEGIPVLYSRDHLSDGSLSCAGYVFENVGKVEIGRNLIDRRPYVIFSAESQRSVNFEILDSQGVVTGLLRPIAGYSSPLAQIQRESFSIQYRAIIRSYRQKERYYFRTMGGADEFCPLPLLS